MHSLSLYKRAVLSFPGCTKLLPPSCCNGELVKHAENISELQSSLLFLETSEGNKGSLNGECKTYMAGNRFSEKKIM